MLMLNNNICSVYANKVKMTTNYKHNYTVFDNIFRSKFWPRKLGESLDIRYYINFDKWRLALYLNIINNLRWLILRIFASETVIPSFKMAKLNRPIVNDIILHLDQWVQYACDEFKNS